MAERNEAVEMDRGSRSALIVALESRETDPRKPVSSKGGCRWSTGMAHGKMEINSESLTNVLTQQWRIITGSETVNPREPDARNGRVRNCGGALGGIRGATRHRLPCRSLVARGRWIGRRPRVIGQGALIGQPGHQCRTGARSYLPQQEMRRRSS